jgi:hypothetical protein
MTSIEELFISLGKTFISGTASFPTLLKCFFEDAASLMKSAPLASYLKV